MRRPQSDDHKKLVPLKRIAEASSYSFGYVSILVQRKKLKAKKIGNKYYSTKEWFDQYLELHARDEKRLSSEAVQELSSSEVSNKQFISESIASAELKSKIDNLVELAVKEKFADQTKQEKIDSAVKKVDAENKFFQKSVEEKISVADETSSNKLAEILNNKIISPEARLIADFVEPEIRLKVKWQENLHQEAKDFLTQQGSIVKKIKTENKKQARIILNKKTKTIISSAALMTTDIFSPRLFKTALVTIIIVLALISLTVFTPSIKIGANKIIKSSFSNANEEKLSLNNNKIIPGEELTQKSKNFLDNSFLTLADRISDLSLKLENNFKRRNQVLVKRLGVIKNQTLDPLFQLAKNQFSGLNLGLTILPDGIVNFGQSNLAILKSFINYQSESVSEIAYLIQEEVNSKPEQIKSNKRQGKVAGVSETTSFISSPMPRLLALANTTSRRGQEVINQTKYNTSVVLEGLADQQKELSLDLGRKLAKLTLATAKGVGLVSKSGQTKLAQAENTINQTNNSVQQIGSSIQEYNNNSKNYLANEAGRSLWSLYDLYSKFIDKIFPESLKNKYAKYYLIETDNERAGIGQVSEQAPTIVEKIIKQTTTVKNSSPASQVVAPTPKNLSIIGDATIGGSLNVSGQTKLKDKLTVSGASEFLGDAVFNSALTIKDLIITGSIKLNGTTITEGSLVSGPQIVNNNTYITGTFSAGHTEVSSLGSTGPVGSQSLSAGEGGLTVAGDTSLNGEHVLIAGMVDLNNILDIDYNGMALTVGDGSNDTFSVNTSDDIVTITGIFNHYGTSQFNGDMDLNGALDLDVASTSAFTVGDGTNDNINIDTINDILTFGNSSTTDQMNLNVRQLAINSASSTTAFTIRQDGDGDLFNLFDGDIEILTVLNGGNVGIGTSSPFAKLTVVGTGIGTSQLVNFSNGDSVQLFSLLENGLASFSGVPTGSGVGQGSLYINPLSGGLGVPVFNSWSAEATWNITGLGTIPVPVLADLDNDGDQDLLIGSSDGVSYAYENTGTASSPTWTARSDWNAPYVGDGFAFPTKADLDNDGDYDLLIGSPDGTMHAYENTGTVSSPAWTLNAIWVTPDLGDYHFPALADLDGDGDYDLMIGVLGTPLYGYENTGTAFAPTWVAKPEWNISAPDNVAFFPAFTDLDNDGDQDLFIGEWMEGTYGLYAYENTGTAFSPTWTANSSWNIADIGSVETAAFADLDNDGDQDLILGEMNGTLYGYKHISLVAGNTLFGVAVNSSEKFKITSVGDVNMTGNLDVGGGANIAENLIVSGNIGVGVASPLNRLDINGGAIIGAAYAGVITAPTNGLLVEGHVGIGTDSPTALLQLGAGTATAGTAPLKFTSGTLLTTPEVGAIEFLNDDYYVTISSGLQSQYPPEQSVTYVKATTENTPQYMAYFATDPSLPLIGDDNDNTWQSDEENTNQRFHIDLGSAKTVSRIYYENAHNSGNYTNSGVRNFTFWGSNDSDAFNNLTYGDDTNWTQLTTSATEFNQHVSSNEPDPKYITVINGNSYRYYAFKFADNWGGFWMSVRRLELQTIASGSSPRKGIVLNDGINLVSGRIPFATINGRLIDSNNLVFTGTNLGIGTPNPLGVFDVRYGEGGLDAYTKFLLQADGSDNSFIDSSESANVITAYGDVTQSTAQSKFGGKSAYFDGNGDYLNFPSSSDFAFGTGDFTIDFWINAPLQSNSFLLGARSAIGNIAITTGGYCGSTPGSLRYTNDPWDGCSHITSTTVITDGTWHHCAIVRESGIIYLYIDGVQEASVADAGNYSNNPGLFTIGKNDWADSEYLTGYLDEYRISKGIARWTTNFTLRTEKYNTGNSGIILTSSGNFGIGTSTPTSILHINGAPGSLSGGLSFGDGDTGLYEYVDDNLRLQTRGVDRLTINESGNVGIGTTSPYAKLSVVGPVVAEYFTATSTTATSTFAGGFLAGNNAALTVNMAAPANSLYINSNGNIGMGTSSALTKLSIQGLAGSDILNIASSAGASLMYINIAGNIGLGTNNPYNLLTVGSYNSGTSNSLKQGLFSTDNMLLSQLEGGTYFGRVGIKENQWGLSNHSSNWTSRDSNNRNYYSVAMSSDGKIQTAVATPGFIYVSNDYGVTWVSKGSDLSWRGVAMSSDGKIQTAVNWNNKIYGSTDYGNTWAIKDSNNRNYYSVAMSSDGKIQTAVVEDGQIYGSTDYGNTWLSKDSNNRSYRGIAMSSDGKIQTAVVLNGYVYGSTDYGNTWSAIRSVTAFYEAIAMSSDGKIQTAVIGGGSANTILISTNYGVTWTTGDPNSRSYTSIAMSSDGKIQTAVVYSGQIYASNNYGVTWTSKDSNSRLYRSVAMSSDGKIQTAVVYSGQIYGSTADTHMPFGNIGIGTTSPTAKLDIYDSSNYPAVNLQGYGSGGYLRIGGVTNNLLGIYMADGSGNLQMYTGNSGSVPKLTILNTGGNVGIGTTNPTAQLTLAAGSTINSLGALTIQSDTSNMLNLDSGTTGNISIGTGAYDKIINIGNTISGTDVIISTGYGPTISEGFLRVLGRMDVSTTDTSAQSYTNDKLSAGFYSTIWQGNTSNRNFYGLYGSTAYTLDWGQTNNGTVLGSSISAIRNDYNDGENVVGGGTLGNLNGLSVRYGAPFGESIGDTTNTSGIELSPGYGGSGTFTNWKDFYIKTPTATGATLTNGHYAIYQEYASAKNYFAGNVGIGTTSPYSLLSLQATAGGTTPLFTIASSTAGAATSTYLTVASNGNIGIGTASPAGILDINGDIIFRNGVNKGSIHVISAYTGSYLRDDGLLGIWSVDILDANYFRSNSHLTIDFDNNGVNPSSNFYIRQGTNNDKRWLTVQGTTGNVGIGTTSPQALLTIGSSTPTYLLAGDKYNSAYISGLLEVGGTGTSTIASNLDVLGNLHATNSYVGDLIFANNFRFTEAANGVYPQALFLQNQNGENIMSFDENGSIVIGKDSSPELGQESKVKIVDLTEITASSTKTAFIVNQSGSGDIADFQVNGVSIMNITQNGQVKVMGSMLVDGRIMLCSGGYCSNALDSAVDETMADLGVEGKVVAGAFEGYCEDGFVWVPGSAKYGTLPGFCVMIDLAVKDETKIPPTPFVKGGNAWTNISQGEANATCQTLGRGYHLIGENEWLTIAENILQVADNDIDPITAGMQLATTSPTFKLNNDNLINNLVGEVGEWTNQNVTVAGLPVTPLADNWFEYGEVSDYKGLNIAPDYYLTDLNNNIGKIYIGSSAGLKGFVRGFTGIYGLDLSHSPSEQAAEIGFRCAK